MISIIIPTLNEETAIKKTITSLKSLSIPHEIIVSDGGSTDQTIAKAQILGVKVVVHPKDKKQTIASNRNNGAKYAIGEFLCFIDCDCRIENPTSFFQKALTHFDNQKIIALTCYVGSEPGLTRLSDRIIFTVINRLYQLMNNILNAGTAVGKFQMIRKEAFQKLSGYNENLVVGEDHDMFRRLSRIGKVRMDYNLQVFHSNRRARKLGWPKLLWLWTVDTLAITFKGKAASEEWTPVR